MQFLIESLILGAIGLTIGAIEVGGHLSRTGQTVRDLFRRSPH